MRRRRPARPPLCLLFRGLLRDDRLAAVLPAAHAHAVRDARRSAVGTGLHHDVVRPRLLAPRRALLSGAGRPATSFLQCHEDLRAAYVPAHEGIFKPLSAARRGSMGGSQVQLAVFRSIPHCGHSPLQVSAHSGANGTASTNCSRSSGSTSTRSPSNGNTSRPSSLTSAPPTPSRP